jgi:HSP20 family protein
MTWKGTADGSAAAVVDCFKLFVRETSMSYQDARDLPRPWCPPVDIYKTDAQYVVKADLPGLSKESISVITRENTVSISGDRAFDPGEESNEHLRLERLHGPFICEVNLPGKLDRDSIKIGYDEGVLVVQVPRA